MNITKRDAYKIKLDGFEGPLDLLLHLVKDNEMDIYDIKIATITKQYLEYIEFMQFLDLDVAGEFIVMAATLMYIKSRTMLPPKEDDDVDQEGEDPRDELVRKLLEYKRFKEVARSFKDLEVRQREVYSKVGVALPKIDNSEKVFEMNLFDLMTAFNKVLKRLPKDAFREIVQDEVTVEEKVDEIKTKLEENETLVFTELLRVVRTKVQIVALFLAILELTKQRYIRVMQDMHFDDIRIVRNNEKKVQQATT